jgi:hypothetical protein
MEAMLDHGVTDVATSDHHFAQARDGMGQQPDAARFTPATAAPSCHADDEHGQRSQFHGNRVLTIRHGTSSCARHGSN